MSFLLNGPIQTPVSPRESQAREMSAQGWTATTPPQRKVTEEAFDRASGSPAQGRGQPREPRTKPARSLARGHVSLTVNSNRTPTRGWTREPSDRARRISSVSYHRYLPCSVLAWSPPPPAFLIHVKPGAGARMANGRRVGDGNLPAVEETFQLKCRLLPPLRWK